MFSIEYNESFGGDLERPALYVDYAAREMTSVESDIEPGGEIYYDEPAPTPCKNEEKFAEEAVLRCISKVYYV